MNKIVGRPLLPDEVEVRIDSISAKSFTVVVYITSRAAMNILDETYGKDKWSRRVKVEKTSDGYFAVCAIEVLLGDGNTVLREDVGEDANSAKAAASDSIKRAATNFIPSLRALYTLPSMRINASKLGIELKSEDKDKSKAELKKAIQFKKFAVSSIAFGNDPSGEFVKALQIVDEETGDIVFEHKSKRTSLGTKKTPELLELKAKMVEAGVTEERVLKEYSDKYGVNTLEELVLMPTLLEKVYDRLELNMENKGSKKASSKTPTKSKSVNDQLKGEEKKEA